MHGGQCGRDCVHGECDDTGCIAHSFVGSVHKEPASLEPDVNHVHSSSCGHESVFHLDHLDFLVGNNLYHADGGLCMSLDGDDSLPAALSVSPPIVDEELALGYHLDDPLKTPAVLVHHEQVHRHTDNCGHEIVVHDGHLDYLVDGQLHHDHGNHCDHHGLVQELQTPEPSCECPPEQDKDAKCRTHGMRTVTSVVEPPTAFRQECLLLVKTSHHRSISISSPAHALKAVTIATARKWQSLLGEINELTIGTLASLPDQRLKRLPSGVQEDVAAAQTSARMLEDLETRESTYLRRVRNADCCARFRRRKRDKLESLNNVVVTMTQKCDSLGAQVDDLEREKQKLLEQIGADALSFPLPI